MASTELKRNSVGQDPMDSCKVCTGRKVLVGSVVMHLLLVAVILACMMIMFTHNNRIELIEAKMAACNCQIEKEDDAAKDTPQQLHDDASSLREKRRILNPVRREHNHTRNEGPRPTEMFESSHILSKHHGIPSSDIALLYADSEALYKAMNHSDPNSPMAFQENDDVEEHCAKTMVNGRGDLWCIPRFPSRQQHRVMLVERVGLYPYLVRAPWMYGDEAKQNFMLVDDGASSLMVKQPGIYQVTSRVSFEDVSDGFVNYGLYVRDRLHSTERHLGSYSSSVPSDNADGTIFRASTWQLAALNAGDRVFFKISPFTWIRVQKDSFYLAVIKLNDWQP